MKFSKFVHFFELSNALALYHAIDIKVIYFPSMRIADKQALLDRTDHQTVEYLSKQGFIVNDNEDETARLATISQKEIEKVDIQLMYLLLTEKYNLACRYCFFEEGMPASSQAKMSVETARNALDCFSNWVSSKGTPNIQLYGGDPLINMDALVLSIDYVQYLIASGKLPKNSYISIICNGTLVNEKFIAFMGNHKDIVNISVSIDGPGRLHDEWRVDHQGRGSYDKTTRGYQLLKDAGLKPAISYTLSPSHIPHLDKITSWIIAQKPNGISFNTMTDIPGMVMNQTYAEQAAKFMIKAFIRFREEGLYEDRMMRKIKSFVAQKRFLKDCCGYGQQIVVAPDGRIGTCHGFTASRKYLVSNVNRLDSFDPYQHPIFQEWAKRSPINMPECHDCLGLGICGGGCALNAYHRNGSIWAIDDIFCPQTKEILAWMIADTHNQMFSP